ncbi:immune inhibitor A [Microbacterium betulae]|uniref:Immune inhibitor A n=1 Tax=Microbacterium betulae TaxID=2981139 RepID=A0AA97I4P5_9MICO|nr:immune inhibitor A domain-containing protein [Microbacterium sp. AB]WOF22816.1 immune inhibitor A [Microbacterium sp. AB]
MRSRTACALGAAFLLAGVLSPAAATAAPADEAPPPDTALPAQADDRPDPLAEKRSAEKQRAAELVATGAAEIQERGSGENTTRSVEIAPDDWVEYGVEETAQLFSILVEFGDTPDERFPDAPTAGPLRNEIPEPAEDDNSTYWEEDFSREHYEEMFFTGLEDQGGESFRGVYEELSSGRFDLQGDVSDWVTVPYAEASYGQTESQADMTRFIQDSADAWYADQLAQGTSPDEIVAYLQSFDVWDRYDLDGDGVTNEPDGYIDHFQAIHAGEGEEAGAPEWAIWSHRWAVNQAGLGVDGPADYAKAGGVRIGDTDIWIRDYTTEPENGGLGVFAHEFGHDLGLPDYYDTAGGENGTGFWTLMSSGSWLGHGDGSIGTTPNHMGATEKLFLGWLDYETIDAGETGTVELGPAFHATTRPQAVVVDLPPGEEFVETGPAASGTRYFFSGSGDSLDNTVTSPAFAVPDAASLTAQVSYDIETDWDYAYAEITTDEGATWTPLATDHSTSDDPNGNNLGEGITGATDGWTPLAADLSAYAGQTAQIRFRYVTDAAVSNPGFQVDDIAVGDALSTDVEDGGEGWERSGFVLIEDGGYTVPFDHYYIAENRAYGGYDTTLAEGPYNFGWALSNENRVEHFPYQDGLLVWYANGLYGDNNTSAHPGGGQALPVDARAAALTWSDGEIARNRIQTFDATFGLDRTDPISLHRETEAGETTLTLPSQAAVPLFDDTDPYAYYDDANPQGSVVVGGTGTTIEVVASDAREGTATVEVRSATDDPLPWEADKVYRAGDTVSYDGATWLAAWYTQGQEPGDPWGPWQEIAPEDENGVAAWTPSRIYERGERASFDGQVYEAQWWTRNQQPGDAWGPWKPES